MERTKLRLGDKVLKLREERELLGRFLIIQESSPELVPRLEETIAEYEMAVVPRSLSQLGAFDRGSQPTATTRNTNSNRKSTSNIVLDAMAVVQGNYNMD